MWAAGAVAAMSSITFPAISAIVSRNAEPDQQGEFPRHLMEKMTASAGMLPSNTVEGDEKTQLFAYPSKCFTFSNDMYVLKCLYLSVGVVQGMITGIRGLCNGLGPALYGFVFYLFHVELTDTDGSEKGAKINMANPTDEVRFLFRRY